MGFAAEMDDFVKGFEAVDKWRTSRSNRAYRDAATEKIKPAPHDPEGPGMPASGGAPVIPDAPDQTETGGTKKTTGKGTRGDEIAWKGASPEQYALLNTIAGPESGGRYNIIYGGGAFDDFSDHPRKDVVIQTGPNAKRTSSAAGKYQFLGSTWDGIAKKYGLTDFSPENQDKAAWYLAAETYGGEDKLMAALKSGDPKTIAGVGEALKGVWTSLPGGIEQGTTTDKFVSTFQNFMGKAPAATAGATPSTTPSTGPEKPKKEEEIEVPSDPGSDPEHAEDPVSANLSFDLPEVAIPEVTAMFVPPSEDEYLQLLAQQQEIPAGGESPWIDTSRSNPVLQAARGGVIPEPTQHFASGGATYTRAPTPAASTSTFTPRRVGSSPLPGATPVSTGPTESQTKFRAIQTNQKAAADKAIADKAAADKAAADAAAKAATTDFYRPTVKQQGQMALFGLNPQQVMTPEQYKSFQQTPVTMGNRNLYGGSLGGGTRQRLHQQQRGGSHWEQGGMIPEPEEQPVQSYARGGVLQVDPALWQKAVRRERPTSGRGAEAGIYAEDTAAKRLNAGSTGRVSSAIRLGKEGPERRKGGGRKGDAHKRGGGKDDDKKRTKDKTETSSTGTPTPAQPKKGRLSDEYVRPNPTPPQPRPGRLSDEYSPNPMQRYKPGRLSDENASPPVPGESYAGQETTPRPMPNYPYPADPGRRETGYPYPADPGRRDVGYPYNPDNPIPDGSMAGEETAFRVPGEDHAGQETTPRPRPNYPYNPDNGPIPGEANAGQEQAPGELEDWYIEMLQREAQRTGIPLETLIVEARGNAAASLPNNPAPAGETSPMENPPDWYRGKGFRRGGAVPEEDDDAGAITSPRAEEANYTTSAPGTMTPGMRGAPPARSAPDTPVVAEGQQEQERMRPTPTLMSMVKEATAGGARFIQRHFGISTGGTDPQETGAIPDPEAGANEQAGLQRFAQGEGAATPDELEAIDNTIDLPQGMAEGGKNMERMARIMNWYLERGRKDDAEAAAASLMMYGANRTGQLGTLASVAYQNGDIDKTIKYLEQAYQMIPDGGSLDVTVDRESGKFFATHTDADGEETQHEVTAQEIPGLIQQVQSKSAYWTAVSRLGDPKGAETRDRREEQRINDERDARIRRGETLDERDYNRKNWDYQHEVEHDEEITDEERKAKADRAKLTEQRGYDEGQDVTKYSQERRDKLADDVTKRSQETTDAAYKQVQELAKERRDNAENNKRALRDAAIAIKKWNLDPDNKQIDQAEFSTRWSAAQEARQAMDSAQTPETRAAYNETLSRLADTIPVKDRGKKLLEVGFDLEDPDFIYVPDEAEADAPDPAKFIVRAEGSPPPAEYPDAKPDVENGVPVWVVTVDGEEFILQEDGQ